MAEAAPKRVGGSTGRFDALYRAHHAEVLLYFMRRLSRSDAEDATAEVFTVAWRRIDDVPQSDRAVAWLFGVAHRVLTNHRRGWRRRLRLSRKLGGLSKPVVATPETQVVRSADDELLLTALSRLRWSDQELLRLVTWERLSSGSIGELYDISEATVRQRIFRARNRLAAEVAGLERKSRITAPARRKEQQDDSAR